MKKTRFGLAAMGLPLTMRSLPMAATVLLLAVLLLAGCTADEQAALEERTPVKLTVAQLSVEPTTRAGTAIQSTQLDEGESFYVYFPENVSVGEATSDCHTIFTVTDAAGNTTPAEQPYFNPGQTTATVHAYYPSTITHQSASFYTGAHLYDGGIGFNVAADQSTEEGYKASDLMYATAELTKTGSTVTGNLVFQHRMAKITANVTAGTDIQTITDIRIVSGSRGIYVLDPLTCTLADRAGVLARNKITPTNYLNMYSGSAATVSASALIPPQTIDGSFLRILTDKGAVTYALDSKSLASGKSYTMHITVNSTSIGATIPVTGWTESETVVVDPVEVVQKTPLGLKMVDLNLYAGGADSGKKLYWANMNIGAEKETDYGTYFRWGEVVGLTVVGSQANVLAENSAADSFFWEWSLSNVRYDDNGNLYPAFDAAIVNWGSRWRMPTKEECEALCATKDNPNYSWEWINNTRYDASNPLSDPRLNGVRITYNVTGESIFIPQGRSYGYTGTGGVVQGHIWTSLWAYTLCIEPRYKRLSVNTLKDSNDRALPIRPVYEEE